MVDQTDLTQPDQIPVATGKNVEAAKTSMLGALHEKEQREAGAMGAMQHRDEETRIRQQEMLSAEHASIDELKHGAWDAKKEMADRQPNLWEEFGSPAFVIAMLGSAFSTMPMVSALNAGGAAIKAINQGAYDDYNRAFKAWQENTELVLKRQQMEHQVYADLDKFRTTDMQRFVQEFRAANSRFDNQRMAALVEQNMWPEVYQAVEGSAKASAILRANYEQQLQQKLMFDRLNGTPELDEKGNGVKGPDGKVKMKGGDPDWKSGDPDRMQIAMDRAKIGSAGGIAAESTPKDLPYRDAFGFPGITNFMSRKLRGLTNMTSEDTVAHTQAAQELEQLHAKIIGSMTADLTPGSRALKDVQNRIDRLFPKIESLMTSWEEGVSQLGVLRSELVKEINENERVVAGGSNYDFKTKEKARARLDRQRQTLQDITNVIESVHRSANPETSKKPWE